MSSELIQHCSPTLAGIKLANLFSIKYESQENLERKVKGLNKVMKDKGIHLKILRCRGQKALVYVYRVRMMKEALANEGIRDLLEKEGYSLTSTEKILEQLKARIESTHDFPHEIGVFLGYPIEDVKGFIENKGKNYLSAGFWKIYSNVALSEEAFRKYKKCTSVYNNKFREGKSLWGLIVNK